MHTSDYSNMNIDQLSKKVEVSKKTDAAIAQAIQ